MTNRLAEELRAHRHLRAARVLCRAYASGLTESVLSGTVRRAAHSANLRCTGPHMLRHTFCSHLAMRGAPAKAIQELEGHQDLTTTQQDMHLSPAAPGCSNPIAGRRNADLQPW
jgi:site-specific recombinase XerD